MARQEIKFSLQFLDDMMIYLDTTVYEVSRETDFKYSLALLYGITRNRININANINKELNRLYFEIFKLDNTDLLNIYKMVELRNKGRLKFKNREGVKNI